MEAPQAIEAGLFTDTGMPDADWWQALWPDPDLTLRQLGIRPVLRAVDLCCGDGWFTPALARLASGTVGVDLDRMLLARAVMRAAQEDAPSCRFVAGNALDLAGLLDAPADLVMIASTLHGVPDRTGFLRTISASLSAEGRIAVINWHRWPRERTLVLGLPRGPHLELRMTPQEVDAAAAAAGLETERLVELPPYHYAMLLRRARTATSGPLAAALEMSAVAGPELWQERLIAFWSDAGLAGWFAKDPAFDAEFRSRFLPRRPSCGCSSTCRSPTRRIRPTRRCRSGFDARSARRSNAMRRFMSTSSSGSGASRIATRSSAGRRRRRRRSSWQRAASRADVPVPS